MKVEHKMAKMIRAMRKRDILTSLLRIRGLIIKRPNEWPKNKIYSLGANQDFFRH